MAIHTIDFHFARAPFVTHSTVTGYEPDVGEGIQLLESRAKQVETETKQRMEDLGLGGSVRVEKGQMARALLKHAGERLLAREAAKLERAGYLVRQFPCVGPPAEEIITVINREHPDLIVTGAKGWSAVVHFLQGSVSIKLIHPECVLDLPC